MTLEGVEKTYTVTQKQEFTMLFTSGIQTTWNICSI